MVRANLDNNMFDVIEKIDEYMQRYDWPYSDWVVGTSVDPVEKLEKQQVLGEAMGPWIYKMAANAEFAKAIEKHFSDSVGTSSESNLEESNARFVYAYRQMRDDENGYVILN